MKTGKRLQVFYQERLVDTLAMTRDQKAAFACGIPFSVPHKAISAQLQETVYDSRSQQNLHGPFANAEDAVTSMLGE